MFRLFKCHILKRYNHIQKTDIVSSPYMKTKIVSFVPHTNSFNQKPDKNNTLFECYRHFKL